MTFQGRQNHKTTVISLYVPTMGTCPGSVFSQQLRYTAENRHLLETECPRELFGQDLEEMIIHYKSEGHNLIVAGDFNAEAVDMRRWMQELGLIDLIDHRHSPCPRTQKRSKNSPIDFIFGSPGLRIRACGYLPFNRLVSDHRALWIDIEYTSFLGYKPPPLLGPAARRLKLEDPAVVSKYLTTLHSILLEKGVFTIANRLDAITTHPLPEWVIELHESLDKILMEAMATAERQCRNLKTGEIPWSPQYAKARYIVEYWQTRIDIHNGLKVHSRHLRKLRILANLPFEPNLGGGILYDKLKRASVNLQQTKVQAEGLRLTYLEELARRKEEAGEINHAAYLRSLGIIEGQRRIFRTIRQVEGRGQKHATTMITFEKDGELQECTDKVPMERLMLGETMRKAHQTEGYSELTTYPLLASLGKFCDGPGVDDILQGTFDIPAEISEPTRDFLHQISIMEPPTFPPLLKKDREERFYRSWKIRKEKTASCGPHFGHYKAIMKDKDLRLFLFQRSEVSTQKGYNLKNTMNCEDVMILKRAGATLVTKLRTLALLNSEWNNLNKIYGKEAMERALAAEHIAPEQFSRPGRSAIDQSLLKRLTFDHMKYKRQCYSICSSDLSGCYDRILHNAAALALLKLGFSKQVIRTMYEPIQKMVHRVRTAFGTSEISSTWEDTENWENAPQGKLQGNASGPSIWSILSSVIFKILRRKGFSSVFCSALSKQLFMLVGFMYVDDADLIQTQGQSPMEVLESMQRLITEWGSLMAVTGGVLETTKSWWYLVEFVWHRGNWIAVDALQDADIELIAVGGDGFQKELKRLSVQEAAEMLGIWMAPNGDPSQLLEILKKDTLVWADKIRNSSTNQEATWYALTKTLSPRLKYCLPVCTFSKKECKSLMAIALNAALGKAGFARNLPSAIRDTDINLGGAGMLDLYLYMGTIRIHLLMEHYFRETPTGSMLKICIEDIVLEIGMEGHLTDADMEAIDSYVDTTSWIYNTLKFANEYDIKLYLPHTQLKKKREYDSCIMTEVAKLNLYGQQYRKINRVRMFYNVTHMSDLTTADGNSLHYEFLCYTIL